LRWGSPALDHRAGRVPARRGKDAPPDGGGRGAVRAVPRLPPQPDVPAYPALPCRRVAAPELVPSRLRRPVARLARGARGRPAAARLDRGDTLPRPARDGAVGLASPRQGHARVSRGTTGPAPGLPARMRPGGAQARPLAAAPGGG